MIIKILKTYLDIYFRYRLMILDIFTLIYFYLFLLGITKHEHLTLLSFLITVFLNLSFFIILKTVYDYIYSRRARNIDRIHQTTKF